MDENKEKKIDYCPELIDYSRHLFDRQVADFDVLDNKALGVIGIAGVLAGFQVLNIDMTIEIIKGLPNKAYCSIPYLALLCLLVHAACLILSVFMALFSFQIKDFDYPGDVSELVSDSDTKEEIIQGIVETYEETSQIIAKIDTGKAEKLEKAVYSIAISIVFLIVYVFLIILFKCK